MARRRADLVLVARGFFASRAKAQEAIAAGLVEIDGCAVRRPAEEIDADAEITAAAAYPWVSRGGVKLAAALDAFDIDPTGLDCLDLGASTGGFTHVLLARGAQRVYAVDVGCGQLHPSLTGDPRVVSMEKQDARQLTAALFAAAPSLLVCDVSFISLKLALPCALSLTAANARLVALIKPQFEAGRQNVKKGVVKDPRSHDRVCVEIADFLESSGWRVTGTIRSPIAGGDGNIEFLIAAIRL